MSEKIKKKEKIQRQKKSDKFFRELKELKASQPLLPATVRDVKTGKTNKRKTKTLNRANRVARATELGANQGLFKLGSEFDKAIADVGGEAVAYERALRAGMKAADIKKKRNAKKMKAGGKVRGSGIAKQGVRAAKMIVMKGS